MNLEVRSHRVIVMILGMQTKAGFFFLPTLGLVAHHRRAHDNKGVRFF